MKLSMAEEGIEYTVSDIITSDEEMVSFLFSLGCYKGEPITVIKQRKNGAIVVIKDARYSIDRLLSEAITVE